MEDFFKNKLNDFDDSGDGWDKPDRDVWESAAQQFPKYPKKRRVDWKTTALSVMTMTILFMGGWMIFVQQNEKELERKLETTTAELQLAKQELDLSQKNCKAESLAVIAENKKADLTIAQLLEAQKQHAFILDQKEKAIKSLWYENQEITNSLKELEALVSGRKDFSEKEYAEGNNPENEAGPKQDDFDERLAITDSGLGVNKLLQYQSININPLKFAKLQLSQRLRIPIDQEITFPTIPVKRKWKKIELGLVLTTKLENPLWGEIEEFKSLTKEASKTNAEHNAIGFHLAYGLRPNFFIKTGIRYAKASSGISISSGSFYDESGKYINDDGKNAQDITLTTWSAYGEMKDNINILIPEDAALETGDIVVSKLDKFVNLQFVHLPLGVEYYFGKEKLQLQLQGGMAWNKLFSEYVPVDGAIYVKDTELGIKEVSNISTTLDRDYWSTYLGTGVNYRFRDRWNLRTAFVFEYDFIDAKTEGKKAIPDPKGLDWVLDVGLYYRF